MGHGILYFPDSKFAALKEGAELRCNLVLPRDYTKLDQILTALGNVTAQCDSIPSKLPVPVAHSYRPSRTDWQSIAEWALKTIEKSALEKIVLARETLVECSQTPDPCVPALDAESRHTKMFPLSVPAIS